MNGQSSELAHIVLPDTLDITQVGELHANLLMTLGQGEIYLVANEVVRVDTAGLQLLVTLLRETQRRRIKLVLASPSQELLDAAIRLGLKEILDSVITADNRSENV